MKSPWKEGVLVLWWALAEGAVVLWFGLPFLAHRRRCMKAMMSPWTPKTDPIEMDAMPEVVVLPTWNETAVIERRPVNSLLSTRGTNQAGVRLMLIDSAR